MAGIPFYDLPPALALNGGELFAVYQQGNLATPWIGVQLTAAQIASYVRHTIALPTSGYVSMRQLVAALASQSQLVTLVEALPSDITNSYNIAWNHGYIISPPDPFITGFLQPTLSYSGGQIITLFALALTFPV